MNSILGIDLGSRRIGLAASDPTGTIAMPLTVLENHGPRQTIQALADICRARKITAIVIGLPLQLNGGDGAAAAAVRQFAETLRAAIQLPVHLWDERLSSGMAERAMLEGDLSRAHRKKIRDRIAAQLILQSYLDAHSTAPTPHSDRFAPTQDESE